MIQLRIMPGRERFPEAAQAFVGRLDSFDGDRREAAGAQTPPAQDEASPLELLRIAHEMSGIVGVDRLATERILIESVAGLERGGQERPGDIDFLDSFFLDDLSAIPADVADGDWPAAIAGYLAEGDAIGVGSRIDVMSEHAFVDEGVGVLRAPKGRWPSPPEHGLALRQQFGVDQALNDLAGSRGWMGVYGPPDIGKTTIPRDILAGDVVERARVLAGLARPEDAFTKPTHRRTAADGYPRQVRRPRAEPTGFEMVMASANNAAVDNVTTEIPGADAIAEIWRDEADYFADIASSTLAATSGAARDQDPTDDREPDQRAGGLVAAKQANMGDRVAFRSAFWFDETTSRSGRGGASSVPRMRTRLIQWRDGTASRLSWDDARALFAKAERRVEELVGQRKAAGSRLERLSGSLGEAARLASEEQRLNGAEAVVREATEASGRALERVEAEIELAMAECGRHVETRPGAMETIFSLGRAARDWRRDPAPLDERLRRAVRHTRSPAS